MTRKSVLFGLFGVALGSVSLIQAATLSTADTRFMKMAAEANMTEAHVGQMAEAQAGQQNVKDFGQKLSNDHTQAYESLTVLANKTGTTIPKGIDVRKDRNVERLMHLKGGSFDRAFLTDEVESHKKTLTEFKSEAEHGENPDVKQWAQTMVPTLEAHLQTAENLAKEEKTAKK